MRKSKHHGLVRVNKTRARNMYNQGYEVLLTMSEFDYNYIPEYRAINTMIDEENFDRLVADYYEENKGKDYSYTVEYWVADLFNKQYVKEYNKKYQIKYKAKKCR